MVYTTQEAARILGLSVTSVQQLVESGELQAWKTRGGHRRIPLAALHAYKSALGGDAVPRAVQATPEVTRILIVEDNPMQREVFDRQIESWGLPVSVSYCETGYEALIEIASRRPDVLLADIVMPGIDGYEVIATILKYPELAGIHIAIVSGLNAEDIQARGGIPPGVVFFPKPVNYDELRGYIRACCASKSRAP